MEIIRGLDSSIEKSKSPVCSVSVCCTAASGFSEIGTIRGGLSKSSRLVI